jgi:hypothetical protein
MYSTACHSPTHKQRGIFGATPTETMHAYRKGMIEVVTLLVLKNVPATKKASLDAIAVHFHKTHRQTYRKKYPATDFSNDIEINSESCPNSL